MLIGIDASRAVTEQRTGTEAYALFLIQALADQNNGRHQLRLYFNQPPPEGLLPADEHIEHCVISFPRMWTHIRLGQELLQHSPDLFFTPAHVIPVSYFGRSMATVHDLGYHYFPEAHTRQQVTYLKWSTKHNARRAKAVLADSQATKDDLIRLYNIDESKINVVYPGLDPLLEPPTKPPFRPPGQAPYLLFLGTIQPRKNLVRLINAFASVADQIPHRLVIGGKLGWQAGDILSAIDEQRPEIVERIELRGYIPEADKARLIAGADGLLYPSLYEGFGFPVLEGNLCGVPVLTAATSSLPELAGDCAALLIPPEDEAALAAGILQLVEDQALRDQLVNCGQQNVQRFTWSRAAEQVWTIIEDMLETEDG